MSEYVDCRECDTECARADGNYGYTFCSCFTAKKPPMTNADRIRVMSDEELAEFLGKLDPHCSDCPASSVCMGCSSTPPRDCAYWFEEWLQQPAEEAAP